MRRLQGKVALITGAASGIGRGVAKLFAAEGASVVVLDINETGVHQTADDIRVVGGTAFAHRLDVTDEAQWQAAMELVLQTYGALHVVCNIAGIGAPSDFEELSLDQWNRELAVNLTGVFLGCKHGVRTIKQAGVGGAIINLGSISAISGAPFQASYNASKGGVRVLTKAVALHCAQRGYGIRCNAVHPTYVDTEMLDPFVGLFGDREAMRVAMSKDVPLGRMATPLDIAKVILFLATDDSAMVTGTEIVADGGHTAGIPTHFEG